MKIVKYVKKGLGALTGAIGVAFTAVGLTALSVGVTTAAAGQTLIDDGASTVGENMQDTFTIMGASCYAIAGFYYEEEA